MGMEKSDPLVHDFKGKPSSSGWGKASIIILIVVIFLGIGTGYVLASMKNGSSSVVSTIGGSSASHVVQKGEVVGSNDEKTFKDTAEGTLQKGGADGEGAYHLVRPGGASQNVYLTSSVIDLSIYVNHKVKVWGQTNAAQGVGWLMDVGRLQVLE